MTDLIDLLLYLSRKAIATYCIAWAVTACFVFPVISLGSFKHIIYLDKQLAKDLDKYYDSYGYMRPKYQLSWEVGSRYIDYCFMYPFIRKRATTNSIKFKMFMWWNAIGLWLFLLMILFAVMRDVFVIS